MADHEFTRAEAARIAALGAGLAHTFDAPSPMPMTRANWSVVERTARIVLRHQHVTRRHGFEWRRDMPVSREVERCQCNDLVRRQAMHELDAKQSCTMRRQAVQQLRGTPAYPLPR